MVAVVVMMLGRRGDCVHGECNGVCSVGLVSPCFMSWIGQFAFMLASCRIFLQDLGRMFGQLSLPCPLLRPEDRMGLLVSFPKGMVSSKPGCGLGILPQNSCRAM